jgi:hypothetical protein
MKVKELLADPARWTQGLLAKDESGRQVGIDSEGAICWCIAGAIRKCYPNYEEAKGARKKILCVIDPETEFPQWRKIVIFNDTATHAEVMKVLEEADV